MLSISALSSSASPSDIAKYAEGEAAAQGGPEDYYSESGNQAGQWIGRGADALGLTTYKREHFEAVLAGRHPQTGEQLGRVGGTGARRPGYDLTFSAPKSVSAIWAVADSTRRTEIELAQAKAVESTLLYIEKNLLVGRRGKAGAEVENVEMVAATFQHGTSRAGDPDLHTHSIIANLARRSDGSFGAIEAADLYKHKMMLGAIYRAQLAEQLRELGYEIQADKDSFKVAHVPDELCKQWSSRRSQIEAALAERGIESAKSAEIAALSTRSSKQATDRAELLKRWSKEAAEHGFTAESVHNIAKAQPAQKEIDTARVLSELTQQQSVFQRKDLFRALAIQCQTAGGGLTRVEMLADELLRGQEIVRLRDSNGKIFFTTQEMRAIEAGMLDSAARLAAETRYALRNNNIVTALQKFEEQNGFALSDEQQKAVRHICQSGGIALVQGGAGTGKSTMLQAARIAWQNAGFHVRGAALAGKAAEGLQQSAGIPSQTLHSLLHELQTGEKALSNKDIVVIDEAGMIGSRQMSQLLKHARNAGAKVVLVGDARQLQAIDAGGAFKALQAAVGAAELHDIRRQRDQADRAMVNALATGRASEALEALQAAGRLHAAPDKAQAMQSMVERWSVERDPTQPGESLMLAGTRAEVRTLNELARQQMRKAGYIWGAEIELNAHNFAEGDRVLFTRNSKALGVKNGTLGTLQKIEHHQKGFYLQVKTDDGQIVRIDPREYEHLQHGYAISTHKAQGVTVTRAYVLANEGMTDREWMYVAGSRHRESLHVYADLDTASDLESLIERSRQKGTSLDFEPEQEQETELMEDEAEIEDERELEM
jgi:Ti-type conjugative transfer relaxase TraA